MRTPNKQAMKAKNSSLSAPTHTIYGRALWLGIFHTITTFDYGCDALAWYDRMTTGWLRYLCVAMVYYDWAGMRKMVNTFDRYALAVDSAHLTDADIAELNNAGRY